MALPRINSRYPVLLMLACTLLIAIPQVLAQLTEEELEYEHIPEVYDPADYEYLIPEAPEGAVAWQTLTQVEEVILEDPDGYDIVKPKFAEAVSALDEQEIKIMGFMYPLDSTEKQAHFLLTAYPPSCPYCLPAGPSQMIEVRCEQPITFTWNPILIEGRLKILEDDEYGLYYRMTAVRLAKE